MRALSRALATTLRWLLFMFVWNDVLCHSVHHSQTMMSSAPLLAASAGPSFDHLSPNRMITERSVEWGEGQMLSLQKYRSIGSSASAQGKLDLKSSNRTSGSPEEAPSIPTTATTDEFLASVQTNPSLYKLSKISRSYFENVDALSSEQRTQLAYRIQVQQRASQEVLIGALEILYCDAHICVTNKPSGVLSVPGPRRNPSLADVVYETLRPPGVSLDQMVVHRLDMATSGILVFALSRQALSKLHLDFRARRVQKTYEALVHGHLHHLEGEIDVDLERDPYNPPFMRIAQPKPDEDQDQDQDQDSAEMMAWQVGKTHKFYTQAPKESLTTWSLCSKEYHQGRPVSRLQLRPWTGRTHQLRVHCADALGAPIVGDDIYGGSTLQEQEQQVGLGKESPPLCLHARQLCMYHPISGAAMVFEADPPF